jgi:subtilisin-like proprotein convertase family protein
MLVLPVGPASAARNASPIQILDSGSPPTAANPYPATIDISGYEGTLTDVDVQLFGLTHSFQNDVDVLLVSPSGVGVMLLSDAGGGPSSTTPVSPEFDDAALSFAPTSGGLGSGPYHPTNYVGQDSTEVMPAPAPAGPYATSLSAFNGQSPNGRWRLYVADDLATDSGQITQGFRLALRTTEGFALGDPGPATDYPAVVEVAGRTTPITGLRVRVNGLAHSWPDDVDLLLVGPRGQSALLMSDAGGGTSRLYEGPSVTFTDSAPLGLMDEDPFTSGVFRPTDFEPGDTFPAPAPPGPYGTSLAVFNGTDPNGTWRLFAQDDGNMGYAGQVEGGFSLEIETPAPPVPPPPPPGGDGGDRTAPIASALGAAPRAFRAAGRGPSAAGRRRVPVGTRVSFSSTEAARARFTIERARRGVRRRGRCVRPRPGVTGPRCTRWVALRGSFGWNAAAGANTLRFSGRLRGRRLRPARYRLVLRLTDAAGNRSARVRTGFRIVP